MWSERVQQAAEQAQRQFTALRPEEINLAFGTFGDIEGLSQQDLTDEGIEQALQLHEQYGTAEAVERAAIGLASGRPLTAAYRRYLKIRPTVEVELNDQPGFGAAVKEAIGLPETVIMPQQVFESQLEALKAIEQAAEPKTRAIEENTAALKEVARRIEENTSELRRTPPMQHIDYHISRFIGPDAASQRRRTMNGESRSRLKQIG